MLPTFPTYCGCSETNLAGQQVSSEERSKRTAGAAARRRDLLATPVSRRCARPLQPLAQLRRQLGCFSWRRRPLQLFGDREWFGAGGLVL